MARFLIDTDDTVLNYYLLPLVGVKKASFGEDFIKTLMSKNGKLCYVELSKFTGKFNSHQNFKSSIKLSNRYFVIFKVPDEFITDTVLLIHGKYSKLSINAKDLIKHYSGLYFNKKTAKGYLTSKAIFALDSHPVLITYYEQYLGLTKEQVDELIIKPKLELMDKLKISDFIESVTLEESI